MTQISAQPGLGTQETPYERAEIPEPYMVRFLAEALLSKIKGIEKLLSSSDIPLECAYPYSYHRALLIAVINVMKGDSRVDFSIEDLEALYNDIQGGLNSALVDWAEAQSFEGCYGDKTEMPPSLNATFQDFKLESNQECALQFKKIQVQAAAKLVITGMVVPGNMRHKDSWAVGRQVVQLLKREAQVDEDKAYDYRLMSDFTVIEACSKSSRELVASLKGTKHEYTEEETLLALLILGKRAKLNGQEYRLLDLAEGVLDPECASSLQSETKEACEALLDGYGLYDILVYGMWPEISLKLGNLNLSGGQILELLKENCQQVLRTMAFNGADLPNAARLNAAKHPIPRA